MRQNDRRDNLHLLQCVMRIVSLIAAVILIVALSVEIIGGDNAHFASWYLDVQLLVCIIFLLDFLVNAMLSRNESLFLLSNLPFLLLSIPYLNIIEWSDVTLSREWTMIVSMAALLRAFLALYLVVRWLVDSHVRRLFTAYILTVVIFTYLSALVFYDFEIGVNPHLDSFGNALWWAWMGVTTVGAAIFPVTVVGKIFAVLLPILGMMMFPIFTIYVTELYTHRKLKG